MPKTHLFLIDCKLLPKVCFAKNTSFSSDLGRFVNPKTSALPKTDKSRDSWLAGRDCSVALQMTKGAILLRPELISPQRMSNPRLRETRKLRAPRRRAHKRAHTRSHTNKNAHIHAHIRASTRAYAHTKQSAQSPQTQGPGPPRRRRGDEPSQSHRAGGTAARNVGRPNPFPSETPVTSHRQNGLIDR